MRLRAIIEYDGTRYRGWQSQRGDGLTIQEGLERALSIVFRETVRVAGAGRTDAGVHARGQVVAFDVAKGLPSLAIGTSSDASGRTPLDLALRAVNGVLPRDLAVRSLAVVAEDFDPRHDACLRAYRYRIWNAPVRSPFECRTAWHVRDPLDVDVMDQAAQQLVGEHDFASFQGADHVPRASVRRVQRSSVVRAGEIVTYVVEANAFARHMVRNIVGELVAMGRGRRSPESMARTLAARDRRLAAPMAPACGLFLEWVRYPEGT